MKNLNVVMCGILIVGNMNLAQAQMDVPVGVQNHPITNAINQVICSTVNLEEYKTSLDLNKAKIKQLKEEIMEDITQSSEGNLYKQQRELLVKTAERLISILSDDDRQKMKELSNLGPALKNNAETKMRKLNFPPPRDPREGNQRQAISRQSNMKINSIVEMKRREVAKMLADRLASLKINNVDFWLETEKKGDLGVSGSRPVLSVSNTGVIALSISNHLNPNVKRTYNSAGGFMNKHTPKRPWYGVEYYSMVDLNTGEIIDGHMEISVELMLATLPSVYDSSVSSLGIIRSENYKEFVIHGKSSVSANALYLYYRNLVQHQESVLKLCGERTQLGEQSTAEDSAASMVQKINAMYGDIQLQQPIQGEGDDHKDPGAERS